LQRPGRRFEAFAQACDQCDQLHLAQQAADGAERRRRYGSMGRLGSTTPPRARQMRRMLAHWQRSGLTLREFGQQRGIPLSTLTWWRQVLRRAGEPMTAASNSVPASDAAVLTEVPRPATVPTTPRRHRARLDPSRAARLGADATRVEAAAE